MSVLCHIRHSSIILGFLLLRFYFIFWFQVIGSEERDAQLLMLLTLTKTLTGLGYRFSVSFYFMLLVINLSF
jgi:hypothetical protein